MYNLIKIQNNIIPLSNFVLFRCNWLIRKLLIIPQHVVIFMLRIFLCIECGDNGLKKMEFYWCLLFFIFILQIKDKTRQAYLGKFTSLSSSLS